MVYNHETISKVMQVFDLDRSGNIGPNEFVALYQFLCTVRTSFQTFDRDRSGNLDWNELAQVICNSTYKLLTISIGIANESHLSFSSGLDWVDVQIRFSQDGKNQFGKLHQ